MLIDDLKVSYSYFYSKVSSRPSSYFSKIDLKVISNFSEFLTEKYGKSIGPNWLFDYFLYQFWYWSDKDVKIKGVIKGVPKVSWVIGNKAYERFENRTKSSLYFFKSSKFYKKFSLIEFLKEGNFNIKPKGSNFFKIEEIERLRFFNTKIGFLHCVTYTSLFNEKSKHCLNCIYKIKCQKLGKEILSNISKDLP